MDSDEIRRSRMQRLAVPRHPPAESRAQPQSAPPGQQTPESDTNPSIERKENSAPKPEAVDDSANKKPSTRSQSTQPVAPKRDDTSVAEVFQLHNGQVPGDWAATLEHGIDSILWDKMNEKFTRPLKYLIDCYARTEKLAKRLPEVAAQVQDSVITLSFISATAAFDDEVHDNLGSSLVDAYASEKLDNKYVSRVLELSRDDEEVYHNLLNSIVRSALSEITYGSPTVRAMFTLLEDALKCPGAAEYAFRIPNKEPTPAVVSNDTLLGKLFGLGLSANGFSRLHPSSLIVDGTIDHLTELAKQAEPMTRLLDDCLFRFAEKFIRHSVDTRRLILNWFGLVLNVNHSQMAMNRIPGKTNSLQLMLNVLKVLLRLSEPFVKLDRQSLLPQLKKVKPEYFSHKLSYDVSDETKVLASQDAPFNAHKLEFSVNFVTECFFLCAGYLHYGFHAAIQATEGFLKRQIYHFESQIQNIGNDPHLGPMPPVLQRVALTRFRGILETAKAEYVSLRTLIHDTELMDRVIRFSEFNLSFDVYAAMNLPASGIDIYVPWDQSPPESYSSFPEFIVEAPLIAATFVIRSMESLRNPSILGNKDLLVEAAIFYMSSPKVLRNPYLRSKFVEILYFGGTDIPLSTGGSVPGTLSSLFTTSNVCRKYLLPALMSVFIDIEHTGRTSQFYEKFTTRDLVSHVLEVIWRDPHYRDQLVYESQTKPEFFVKFVALLLNDATYLFDEALSALLKVHNLQRETSETRSASPTTTDSSENPENVRRSANQERGEEATSDNMDEGEETSEENAEADDPESRLRDAERSARNFLQLSQSTIALLNTFTSAVPHIFATPEIMDRFSIMLNYNLAALVGPKCNQLKVTNASELGFNPRQLLADLMKVYLNLRNEKPFPMSLAKDERSYSDGNFAKAIRIVSKFSLLSPIDLENFEVLAKKTKEAWQEAQEEDEDFGDDVPDEFLDPLMYDIMKNPVTLPTSRVNIDYSTIKTHLLSDPTDPFNRVPLNIEDVIPNHELKKEIEEFKARKKELRRKAKLQNSAEDASMDTS